MQSYDPPMSQHPDESIFAAEGEMAVLMQNKDWSKTPLGPVAQWPQSLKIMIRTVLRSHYPMFIWWGPELTMFHNDAYAAVLGKKHPAALGQRASDVWSDIWPIVGSMVKTVIEQGQAVFRKELELTMERYHFAEETYFTFSYSPILDDQGAIGGVFCACADETAQIISRRRLRLLRELADRATLARTDGEALTSAISIIASDARDIPFALAYLYDASQQTAQLMSFHGLEDAPEQRPKLIDLQGDAPSHDAWNLREVLRSGHASIHEKPEHLGKPNVPVHACVLPIAQSGTEDMAGFLVLGTSPQLSFDEDYRTFCELVGAQLATALATSRAYQAEKRRAEELREIDRAKTLFFSNVSHEFRTPLTLMLGPLEDLLQKSQSSLDHDSRREIELVHRNGLRLLKLVNTLLDFSRIEAGRIKACYQETDIAALTKHLSSVFRSAIEKAGMEFDVHCEDLPQPVFIDHDKWEKIVFNLLSNAFKYTLAGKITITLQDKGSGLVLAVADTGIGIPESEIPHLFERFHRVEGARGRTHEGSGIGLALVQELIKLHGGHVQAESVLGQGSVFRVFVPYGYRHLPKEHVGAKQLGPYQAHNAESFAGKAMSWLPWVETSPDVAAAPRYPGSEATRYERTAGARILLADDNADMLSYVAGLLDPIWQVERVTNGLDALNRAREFPPDLVLSDVMMPVLDGIGLVQALRADPRTSSIPIILLSARAGEESLIEGMNTGADDYLVKPFNARELLARVGAHLQMARFREEANQRLRSSQESFRLRTAQFETLFHQAPMGVYLIGPDFRIRELNPVALPIFDNIPGGVIGRDFEEIIHILWEKNYADEVVSIFRHTLATGESHFEPKRIERRADRGVTEYYEWRVDRLPLPEGGFGVVCYFRDISEQVKAQEALQESEAQFRAFVTASSDIVFRVSPDWSDIRYLEGRDFIPARPDPHRTWLATYVHPDDQQQVKQAVSHAIKSKSRFELEHRVVRLDGSTSWVLSRAIPRFNAEGSIYEWFGAASDVTARRQAEEAGRATQQRLQFMLDCMPVKVSINRPKGEVEYLNPYWLEYTGMPLETIKSLGSKSFIHPEDFPACIKAWEDSIASGRPFQIQQRFLRADQVYRWHITRIIPMFDEQSHIIMWIGTSTDVHDLKMAEEALREADRRKDEFLAILSHELRSPLNVISGNIELLRLEEPESPEFFESLDAIERHTAAQAQLISDLLDVSRIITGKLALTTNPFPFADVLDGALQTVRFAAENKDIQLDLSFDGLALGVMVGDATRLQQVIWNLLTNAVKFTPRGGCIRLDAQRSKDWIEVSVTDDGQGIAPDFLPHVFDRFHQEDESNTRRYGGLGLGLSIVRHIVEMHGGSVEARSQGRGFGASFVVRLPVQTNRLPGPPSESRSLMPAETDASRMKQQLAGFRILVIDDQADVRDMLFKGLSKFGAELNLAASAEEGEKALKSGHFSTLICDVGMPGLNGFDFMHQWRASEKAAHRPPIAAVALTAYASDQDRDIALAAGFQRHMAKPVKIAELAQVIVDLGMTAP